METLSALADGFAVALTWQNLGLALLGCFLGTVFGALRDIGYDDVISIENEDYSLDTRTAIAESVDTLRFAIAESARRRAEA